MSFFTKKENEELFSLLEREEQASEEFKIDTESHRKPSHALTPEELEGFGSESKAKQSSTNALEALKKRMLEAQTEPNKFEKEDDELTVNEKTEEKKIKSSNEDSPSLLEKCRPYIVDDKGDDAAMHEAPTYRLQSVAEILDSESKKTLDTLSKRYEISFDDLGKYSTVDNKPTEGKKQPEPDNTPLTVNETPKEVFEDVIPSFGGVQTNVPLISDIDMPEITEPEPPDDTANTATIRFTLVPDSDNTSRISISSSTKQIDLTGELTAMNSGEDYTEDAEVKLEQTEFEDFVPEKEYSSADDTKHFIRLFSIKKRSRFIKAVVSVFFTLLLAFGKLPFMSEILLSRTTVSGLISTFMLLIIVAVNYDMFVSFKNIFNRRQTPDICAATASLSVTAYGIVASLAGEIALDILILCGVILSVRAVTAFLNSSQLLLSFRQIAGNNKKRAVKLISDRAVTFAMAKNSIEGDVLAAAPQRTRHIDGFLKQTGFRVFLGGRLPIITVISVILSLISGFASAAYYDGAIYGLYSAAAIQCFAALPVIFLVDNLPLYSSAKRLSKIGAMLAGKTGAEQIENANAIVLSSNDLFPSGTVILNQMKVLSDNSIDDTIIRAAALTDALDSPLSTIFKKIANTGGEDVILPECDTVKYEDRMGISGWVDNKLLFIGNRALMEAHGIEVPSLKVDHKILRQGYFPVYVATEDKACALIVVQYNVRPEISRELRNVSALGVTMLINSSDPNMTEEMICDYMGLYDDSVKVMSAAGCHMYKNAVTYAPSVSAPAAYKGSPLGLASIINSAGKIKKSNLLLTVIYVLASVLGAILFAYLSFDGSGTLTDGGTVLLYNLSASVLAYLLYLIRKP